MTEDERFKTIRVEKRARRILSLIPQSMFEALKAEAESLETSVNEIVNRALYDYLHRRGRLK